jgi:hypothetical protein
MKTPINNDNVYKMGTTIYARVNPTVKLFILDYKSRIYYCNAAGAEGGAVLAFYERELTSQNQPF